MNPQSRVVAITTVVAVALLATACGSPSSSAGSGASANAGGSAGYVAAVAYSRCVRSHGVPDFPDPDSSGQLSKQVIVQLPVSRSVLAAATGACAGLNPNNPPSPAQQQQELADYLKFAQCMRAHGLPGFPDPTNSYGRVEFVLSVSKDGFDPHSAQVLAKAHECESVLPAGSGLPSVTETS